MPLHPNVRRCTHIQITGHRCGSPALKQEYFCYFHTRMIKGVQTRVDAQIHPVALIENAEAIQAAIMHMIDAVLKGNIDNKRANIILKALHIAVRNSRNVHFQIRPGDMVHEVPNYAAQYLTEHPEPKHPEPREDSRLGSPGSSAESSEANPTADGAAATITNPAAERRQNAAHGASRGKNDKHHQAPEERKTTFDPSQLEFTSAPGRNSPPETFTDTTPPLTNRQTEHWEEIKKIEASIEGAMHGNWRDLRTVFNAVGLTPRKPPISQKVASRKKVRGG